MGRKPSAAWSAISDQAERRKAQNRLSQRKRRQREAESPHTEPTVQNLNGEVTQHYNHYNYHSASSVALKESIDNDKNDREAFDSSEPTTCMTSNEYLASQESSELYSILNEQGLERLALPPMVQNFDCAHDALSSSNWPEGMFDCFDTDLQMVRVATLENTSKSSSLPGIQEEPAATTPWFYGSGENNESPGPKPSPNEPFREHLSAPSSTAPLKERLDFLLSISRHLGFTSLDSVLLSYYTTRFDAHSLLNEAQRRSRRRDLRDLLIQLTRHSHGWSHWESEGLREALMVSAEVLIRREAGDWRMTRIESKMDNEMKTISRIKMLKDLIPNTWDLLWGTGVAFLGESDAVDFVHDAVSHLCLQHEIV